MENLKAEVKDSSTIPDTVKSTAFLDACNILNCNNEVSETIEELSTILGADIQPILRRYLPLPNCYVRGMNCINDYCLIKCANYCPWIAMEYGIQMSRSKLTS
jgi:hypothetical protein